MRWNLKYSTTIQGSKYKMSYAASISIFNYLFSSIAIQIFMTLQNKCEKIQFLAIILLFIVDFALIFYKRHFPINLVDCMY